MASASVISVAGTQSCSLPTGPRAERGQHQRAQGRRGGAVAPGVPTDEIS
jgi:hypothetical protein